MSDAARAVGALARTDAIRANPARTRAVRMISPQCNCGPIIAPSRESGLVASASAWSGRLRRRDRLDVVIRVLGEHVRERPIDPQTVDQQVADREPQLRCIRVLA